MFRIIGTKDGAEIVLADGLADHETDCVLYLLKSWYENEVDDLRCDVA